MPGLILPCSLFIRIRIINLIIWLVKLIVLAFVTGLLRNVTVYEHCCIFRLFYFFQIYQNRFLSHTVKYLIDIFVLPLEYFSLDIIDDTSIDFKTYFVSGTFNPLKSSILLCIIDVYVLHFLSNSTHFSLTHSPLQYLRVF